MSSVLKATDNFFNNTFKKLTTGNVLIVVSQLLSKVTATSYRL